MAGNRSIIIRSRIKAYLAGFLGLFARFAMPWIHAANAGKTRVLVFHHIDDAKLFGQIIQNLTRRFNVISFEDYLHNKKASDRINVILALDDGYRSWFDAARPVFQEHKVKPLLFVSSDFLGLAEPEAKDYCATRIKTWQEASLTWEQLSTLAQEGAEIGGHALGHSNLLKTEEGSLLSVIAQDRQNLETRLGIPVRSFSYPFGLYHKDMADKVRETGYHYAFTSDSGFLEESEGPFLLKRTNIGLRMPFVVEAYAEGWGDRLLAFTRFIKRQKA